MLLSSAAILEAAVGRLPLRVVVEGAPFTFYAGGDLIILAGILYDLTSRGRVHPVWIWGGGALVASQFVRVAIMDRSEEHTSELQSLMRISYAVFCLKKKTKQEIHTENILISKTRQLYNDD